jgi:hypothetical protein
VFLNLALEVPSEVQPGLIAASINGVEGYLDMIASSVPMFASSDEEN